MTGLLSADKQTHLAHVILQALQTCRDVRLVEESPLILREIKRVISEQMTLEQTLDQTIRNRLHSYSRPIPEGSTEWDVLYQKMYSEELRKRNLGS